MLLDLNDDVLRQVCAQLFGRDAFNVSLASKRLHALAIPNVASVFRTWDLRKLRQFHRYVLHGTQRRVQYLKCLILYCDIYRFALHVADEDSDSHSRAADLQEAVDLTVDLLTNAHNLCRLSLDCLHLLMEYDARVLPALAALRYLRRVDFDTVSDPTVAWVGKTGWNLHTLSLDYDDPEVVNRPHIQNHRCTLPILLDTIAQFPYLHTLKVGSCRFSLSLSDIPNYDPPIFRSVRKLFLWNATPRALDLVNLFPNVSLVDFDYDPLYDQEEFQPSLGPRWPPIDSLILTSLDTVRCASQRLNTARHIQIGRDISVADPDGTDSRNIATLVDVLQKVSPVHAQLSVEVGTPPMRFWARVEAVAPRLRYLELKVSLEDLKQEYASWLVCLSTHRASHYQAHTKPYDRTISQTHYDPFPSCICVCTYRNSRSYTLSGTRRQEISC